MLYNLVALNKIYHKMSIHQEGEIIGQAPSEAARIVNGTNTPEQLVDALTQHVPKKERIIYREPKILRVYGDDPEEKARGVEYPHFKEIRWNTFTEPADDPNAILLMRKLNKVPIDEAIKTGHLSAEAALGEPEFRDRKMHQRKYAEEDPFRLAKKYIEISHGVWYGELDPILHTTFNLAAKDLPGYMGTNIIYKVPKEWVLAHEGELFGNMGEEEIAYFHGFPEEFVDEIIENKGKDTPKIWTKAEIEAEKARARAEDDDSQNDHTKKEPESTFYF